MKRTRIVVEITDYEPREAAQIALQALTGRFPRMGQRKMVVDATALPDAPDAEPPAVW